MSFFIFFIFLMLMTYFPNPVFSDERKVNPIFDKLSDQSTLELQNFNFIADRDNFSTNNYEIVNAEIRFLFENEKDMQLVIHPEVRVDILDRSQNRYIPNETYFLYYSPHFEFSIGLQMVSWGVSNSFNPTDILNRYDFEYNYFDPEKMGEFMVNFKHITDKVGPFSEVTFFFTLLPIFQETPLPEPDSRFALQGNIGGVNFGQDDNQDTSGYPESIAGAFEVSAKVHPVDLSFHFYHGPDRVPGYLLTVDTTGVLRLKPFYYNIDMIGFNVEAAVSDVKFYLESAYKFTGFNDARFHDIPFEDNSAIPINYFQFVPGFDYTLRHVFSKGDLILIVEYLGEVNHATSLREFRPFKNDIFFGVQYDFLNHQGTQIEAGIIKDLGNEQAIIQAKIASKIYKELKLSVGGTYIYAAAGRSSALSTFRNNSEVFMKLSYSFGGKIRKIE